MKNIKPWHILIAAFLIFCLSEYRVINFFNNNTELNLVENLLRSSENTLQDLLFQHPKNIDERIKLITVDEESLAAIGQWPWDRSIHAQLLDKLAAGHAAAVGMDFIFSEYSTSPEADAALVEAAKRTGNFVAASYGDFEEKTVNGKLIAKNFYEPFPELKAVCTSGHINVIPDPKDGVVRQSLNSFQFNGKTIDSFDVALYNQYMKSMGKKADLSKLLQDRWNESYIEYVEVAGKFSPMPYYMVLDGSCDPEYFEDAIVLVGPYTVGTNDFYRTSIDKSTPTYGIEIHGNILQNLLHNNFKERVAFGYNFIVLLLFGGIGFFISWKFNPVKSAIVTIGASGLYILAAKQVFSNGYLLSIFFPITFIIVTYLLMLAYNYIKELLEKIRVTGIFGRYVAPQVVEQILKGGEESLKLGGTRKIISVLFVDIRGFTPMSESAQPEEVVEILNDYLDLTSRSIFQFEGTLDKFIGDATMAIFNAPLELEDHAFKAVQAAWAMKQGSYVLRERLEEKFGRSVQFGIGVNTGPAVVGNIGSKTRMDYTAIGDTVNTSARLEANAKPGQILLSQSTYDLVKDRVKATYLGEISVKGKTQGVPIYELEGVLNDDGTEKQS